MVGRLIQWYQRLRAFKYWIFSNCKRVTGRPILRQPVQLVGPGRIIFKGRVNLGFFPSPYALNGYVYIEARTAESFVEFGDGVWVNNNSVFVSNGPGIVIGNRTMIGSHCEIMDSNFHDTAPDKRMDPKGKPQQGKVVIGENVMIGSNVRILKGVRIGDNTVIGNGSVVVRSIPANMLAMGNPVKCGPLVSSPLWESQRSEATE